MQNDKCVGFGVLMNFTEFRSICPLYADSDRIAIALFAKLTEHLDDDFLYVSAQSHQRVTMDFCHRLKLDFLYCEVRSCNTQAMTFVKSLDMRKVFTTHDYWPV